MKCIYACLCLLLCVNTTYAQENYEIQVYGSQTLAKGSTMFELHSNFTFAGRKNVEDGVLPTNHVLHETVEITHGFTDWFETGFYLFNVIGSDNRTGFVGSHIRPRVMVPESWHWPVGLSLSVEGGYQNRQYSADDWTLEVRPIIDKTWKKFYVAFNPTFDKSFHGLNEKSGYGFSPNLKASYSITGKIAAGLEYYGAVGNITMFDPYQQQEHQLFIAADVDFSSDWEFNAGYGLGFTNATDNGIFKVILGYRLHRKQGNSGTSK